MQEGLNEERLYTFSIFPYDVLKLIFIQCDPKTRYALSVTCKRLFSEFYQHAFQRRWLMIGLEPPSLDTLPNKYVKCTKCGIVLLKHKEKTHNCQPEQKNRIKYCIWCLQRVGKRKEHVCTRLLRCGSCGILLDEGPSHKCPLILINCTDEKCELGKHRRVLFQSCEICDEQSFLLKNVCPIALPRCADHAVYECFGCGELVDPAHQEQLGLKHVCKYFKQEIEASLHVRLKPLGPNVLVTETGTGFGNLLYIMLVKTVNDIPSLLPYDMVRVCLFKADLPLIVNFKQIPIHDSQWHANVDRHCWYCCTTLLGLFWCDCNKVMFCSLKCQSMHVKHKEFCHGMNDLKSIKKFH